MQASTNRLVTRRILSLLAGVVLLTAFSSAATAANLDLAWDHSPSAGVAGYTIHYGTTPGEYTDSKDVGLNTQTTLWGLAEGQTYYIAASSYTADGAQSSLSTAISHTIPAGNTPPTANAGADLIVAAGDVVTLDGSASADPGGSIAAWSWVQIAGPSANGFADMGQTCVFTAPMPPTDSAVMSFRLTVTDNDGATATDTVDVTVRVGGQTADSDGDGIADSDELNIYGTDPYNPDSDGDGVDDGEEIAAGTDPLVPETMSVDFDLDSGEFEAKHFWKRVDFNHQVKNPVVIANVCCMTDEDPATVEIRNIDEWGFAIRLREWPNQDGKHIGNVSWMAIEQGVHTLPDGTTIEAGQVVTDMRFPTTDYLQFQGGFDEVPVVMASLAENQTGDTLATRFKEASTSRIKYTVQGYEDSVPAASSIVMQYVAWEPSAGWIGDFQFEVACSTESITHDPTHFAFGQQFGSEPSLMAEMQTMNGRDAANIRRIGKSEHGVDLCIDEETVTDDETTHTYEAVGYVALVNTRNPITNRAADMQVVQSLLLLGNGE